MHLIRDTYILTSFSQYIRKDLVSALSRKDLVFAPSLAAIQLYKVGGMVCIVVHMETQFSPFGTHYEN